MSAVTPDTNLRLLKLDNELDEKNQLTFSNLASQTSYFLGLTGLDVDYFTYQRKDSIIRYPAHIDTILEYNYVMYQNEHYGTKYFYAFIEDMRYINDSMTEITIKTDVFQTWQFDFELKKSFVERETVADDTKGKHTVPENIEVGEYICNVHDKDSFMDSYSEDLCFILASTSEPLSRKCIKYTCTFSAYLTVYIPPLCIIDMTQHLQLTLFWKSTQIAVKLMQ